MSIKCISVDDEPLARKGLALSLERFPEFELVDQYESVDAVFANKQPQCDIIFLDIEMPRTNGFELLRQWQGELPMVIFVTAYNQYAIQAFEAEAQDYLLKPIDDDRFSKVLERAKSNFTARKRQSDFVELEQTISQLKKQLVKKGAAISVKTDEGYVRVKVNDILYLEAVGNHVCFHLETSQLISRDTLKNVLTTLEEHNFFQIHKSYVINKTKVIKITKLNFGDQQLELMNGQTLRMSRRYRKYFGELSE